MAVAAICVVTPVTEAAAKRSLGSRSLARPMKGADVRELQRLLTAWGLPLQADGVFGRRTTRAVRSWERASARRVDGRVSRRDARALRLAVERGERLPGSEPDTTAAAPSAPGDMATLARDGTAIAPASAPEAVKEIIAAGNEIHDLPYKYGGGHGSWDDTGYDCSGSMSYALHGAGLLDEALDSTGFMRWGEAGAGEWVTTYANSGHSYMVVAGLRFDTSGRAEDNSRWHASMRSARGYTVRHPAGL
jgi:Putative peptidoglycan binding domain